MKNHVALVTGAGSGIGAATAKLLARRGARVGLLAHSEEELKQVAADIGAEQALVLVADVTDEAAVKRAVDRLADHWGRLDIVVANAGINGVWAPVHELPPAEFRRTLDVNLTGTFLTIHHAAPHLKRRGKGAIVVVASINGTRKFGNTGATAYAASKAGQVALTKLLALELAPDKVRVNVVCPGYTDTDIEESTEQRDLDEVKVPREYPEGTMPLTDGQPGAPEQVAEAIAFLASDAASLITGTELWIDGAESLLEG